MSSADPPLHDQPEFTADALLAGPRGRTLCVNLVDDLVAPRRQRVPRARLAALDYALAADVVSCARKLAECVTLAGLSGAPVSGSALLAGLTATVDFATYWQEPDPEDQWFAHEAVREALRPVAQAVVVATQALDARWWTATVDLDRQRYVQFLDGHPLPEPLLTGAAAAVDGWLADTLADERSADGRPADPAASYSGHWWSDPALSGLVVTTRALPGLGAARLALVEDGLGWRSARCWPVAPKDGARVYEIRGPDQWAELVDRYPLDVSKSRRHDWWRVTGWAGQWLIPDYAAVAADWDAVHVSVAGYLTTAGMAIPAGDGARTMLAGWDPDATWWLTDALSLAGPTQEWQAADRASIGWTLAANG